MDKRLNGRQLAELQRLVDFERDKCSASGMVVYQCAFPLRPHDPLQAELVEAGVLAVKSSADSDKPFVAITQEGYALIEEREEADREQRRMERRDWTVVLVSGLFAMLCTVIGVLLGMSLA